MKFSVITPNGIFEILQNASYGELLISILLVILIVLVGLKFLWEVACREGWL
ncbi:MAG: hypothetical protein PWQ59_1375 [Thermoanaerobacterium sp.]|nr:hypothetical protein [Thermoanaerobacterium sp.]MDI3529473.1 hypothetical protein [Thermoanaerobacter sp.]